MSDGFVDRLAQALGDRYRIIRPVGRGGMATVYLADDLRYERPVALKVMHPELLSSAAAQRFHREIRVAARLQHPNLVPVFDSGESEGILWYAMPFVEGESLRARMERGSLDTSDAVAITRAVAAALDYAHRRGVMHRDVKPENILLHEGGALLADFGIARALDAADPRLTETGLAIGTLAYMSPEQASGDPDVDGRSDVFSLGAVLFEMLTGESPLRGLDTLQMTRPDVPASVTIALGRALSPDRERRFPTAADFAQALLVHSLAPDAPVPGSLAVLPFANLGADTEDEHFSDGMTDELIQALGKIEGLKVVSRTSVFALKAQALDVRSIGHRLNVGSVLEGSVRRAGSRLRVTAQLVNVADGYHMWSARFDRQMDDVFAIQDEIARAIASTLRVKLLGPAEGEPVKPPTRDMEAYTLYLKGRQLWNRRTVESVWQGLAHFERALVRDPQFALAHVAVAESYVILGFYSAMRPDQVFPRARAAAERALDIEPGIAEAYPALAYVSMYHDWQWNTAEHLMRRAVELNPGNSTAHQWYGNLLTLLGRSSEGVASFARAVELDPLSAVKTAAQAWGLYFGRRLDEAAAQCHRALEIDPDSVVAHLWLGQTALVQGQGAEAIKQFGEAARLSKRDPMAIAGLAAANASAGMDVDARTLLAEVMAFRESRYVSPFDIAMVHVALRDHDAALEWLERGYSERAHWMALLKVEPRLDPLRGSERFERLLELMAFPPAQ